MRYAAILLIVLLTGCLVTGCGNKPEQTSATQVESKPDVSPKPAEVEAPPAPRPEPAVPKPVPGSGKWVTTKSGLKHKDVLIGRGPEAVAGKTVTVHYKGWLDNGKVFDASKPRGEPFSFGLGQGQVIRGWDEGVAGMRVGGKRELVIPPALGYGDEEQGTIPANSTLHFEVELLKVEG